MTNIDIIEHYEDFLVGAKAVYTSDQFARLKEHILGERDTISSLQSEKEWLEKECSDKAELIEEYISEIDRLKELNRTYENEIDELTQRATDLQDIINNLERKGYQ